MNPSYLKEVSRTFALTIPLLEQPLSDVVTDAYLVFRLLDTIEDEKELAYEIQQEFIHRWLKLLSKKTPPLKVEVEAFSSELNSNLCTTASPHEKLLVDAAFDLLNRIFSLDPQQRIAIVKTAHIMGEGMLEFQRKKQVDTLEDLERYCYFVAGCIGELLTELFEIQSPQYALGRSFGIGLQLTNILKDVEEDQARGVSWIPPQHRNQQGLLTIANNTKRHLNLAVDYITSIPKKKRAIRRFCYTTLILSFLTLRALKKGKKKVSKKTVLFAYFFSKFGSRCNWMVRLCKRW